MMHLNDNQLDIDLSLLLKYNIKGEWSSGSTKSGRTLR